MTASFSSLNLVFLGPPGARMRVHARSLAERYRIVDLSMDEVLGNELRDQTSYGEQVAEVARNGGAIPDRLMRGIVVKHLHRDRCARGFLLVGFPGTVDQASFLDRVLSEHGRSLERVLLFTAPEEGELSAEDEELRLSPQDVSSLADYYKRRGLLIEIDGSRPEQEVAESILQVVGAPGGA